MAAAACDSGPNGSAAGPDPAGQYRIIHGYDATLEVEPRGAGYSVAWRADGQVTYGGMALYADNVLGGVFWPGDESGDANLRVMVYRAKDGKLSGTWIPVGNKVGTPGREELSGPGDFAGRHDITQGQRPDERGAYGGHVEIARIGQTYRARWLQNGTAFLGSGIRVGDLLVVGYSDQELPGVIAYCMTEIGGRGLWTSGAGGDLIPEYFARSGVDPNAVAAADSNCR